jgi:hypothetical protein
VQGHVQQLAGVEDDVVGRLGKAQLHGLQALLETLAMAMVWNMFWMKGNTSPPAARLARLAACSANSLQPPPAGISPTPASTRPT